jgi:hypothetical protein
MAQRRQLENDPIAQLSLALPAAGEAGIGEDLDLRSRATLAVLIDAMSRISELPNRIERNPAICPNCDSLATSKTSPYCSDCCRERAAFVRQMRYGLASGSILDEHRQTMKGEVLWRLLGAGVPRRLAHVAEKARERVFKKAEGKCESCGAPATTIDNTGSG